METRAETIAGLIEELRLPRQTVLVERNGEALRREQWAVEVLRVAGGG
jgi:sulfur carrier protein ThiS